MQKSSSSAPGIIRKTGKKRRKSVRSKSSSTGIRPEILQQTSSPMSVVLNPSLAQPNASKRNGVTPGPDGLSPSGVTTAKRITRFQRRKKKKTVTQEKPSHSLRLMKKRSDQENKNKRVSKGGTQYRSERAVMVGHRRNTSEERRAMHRVNERQRHQSLNDAIKELVKILPPSDAHKSVTKYNILRKASDYIDFLQHKISHLCCELSIEQKIQDGRISFSVPLNTIVDGEQLAIPALTPISPKVLQGIHKAARNVPMDQPAGRAAGEINRKILFSRSHPFGLKRKSPQAKTKSNKTPSTTLGLEGDEKIPHTLSEPPTLPREVVPSAVEAGSDSDHRDLVVDETPPSTDTDLSPGVAENQTMSWKPKQLRKPFPFTSSLSPQQHHRRKSSWPRKMGSPPTSPAGLDREQRKKLLDHYINVDSSPDGGYAAPTLTPKPVKVESSSANCPSVGTSPVDGTPVKSSEIPQQQLHSEQSYSANIHPTYTASLDIPLETKLPSNTLPLSTLPIDTTLPPPLESSSIFHPKILDTQVVTTSHGQGMVSHQSSDVPGIYSSALYVQQQLISVPFKMVTCESLTPTTTLVHPLTAATTHPAKITASTSASHNAPRFIPIQPATSAPSSDAVVKQIQQTAVYGADSDNAFLQNNQASAASAQKLVADPSCLRFEDSDSPMEIDCDNGDSSIMTPTATSGCSMRRSWINGYQLFTKVNHPRFRAKWPRLQGREITRLLSQVWKELPTGLKKHYSRRAREWNQWHRCKREAANQAVREE